MVKKIVATMHIRPESLNSTSHFSTPNKILAVEVKMLKKSVLILQKGKYASKTTTIFEYESSADLEGRTQDDPEHGCR
jgi:hypothetical protein